MQNKNYILQLFSCMFNALTGWFFSKLESCTSIFNLCIISSIMSLRNKYSVGQCRNSKFWCHGICGIRWLSQRNYFDAPNLNAWEEGGILILSGIVIFIISIFCSIYLWKKLNIDKKKKYRNYINYNSYRLFSYAIYY